MNQEEKKRDACSLGGECLVCNYKHCKNCGWMEDDCQCANYKECKNQPPTTEKLVITPLQAERFLAEGVKGNYVISQHLPTPTTESWIKKFRSEYQQQPTYDKTLEYTENFIHSLLAQKDTEWREKLKEFRHEYRNEPVSSRYDQALDALLQPNPKDN